MDAPENVEASPAVKKRMKPVEYTITEVQAMLDFCDKTKLSWNGPTVWQRFEPECNGDNRFPHRAPDSRRSFLRLTKQQWIIEWKQQHTSTKSASLRAAHQQKKRTPIAAVVESASKRRLPPHPEETSSFERLAEGHDEENDHIDDNDDDDGDDDDDDGGGGGSVLVVGSNSSDVPPIESMPVRVLAELAYSKELYYDERSGPNAAAIPQYSKKDLIANPYHNKYLTAHCQLASLSAEEKATWKATSCQHGLHKTLIGEDDLLSDLWYQSTNVYSKLARPRIFYANAGTGGDITMSNIGILSREDIIEWSNDVPALQQLLGITRLCCKRRGSKFQTPEGEAMKQGLQVGKQKAQLATEEPWKFMKWWMNCYMILNSRSTHIYPPGIKTFVDPQIMHGIITFMEGTSNSAASMYNKLKEWCLYLKEMAVASSPEFFAIRSITRAALHSTTKKLAFYQQQKRNDFLGKLLLPDLVKLKIMPSELEFSTMLKNMGMWLNQAMEWVGKQLAKQKHIPTPVLHDIAAVLKTLCIVFGGGLRKDLPSNFTTNNIGFDVERDIDGVERVRGASFTPGIEKVGRDEPSLKLSERLVYPLYFYVEFIRPLLKPQTNVVSYWIGSDGKAELDSTFSDQVGRATYAFCGIRVLPLQLRRYFATQGLQILTIAFDYTLEQAEETMAMIMRTAADHIHSNYSLLDAPAQRKEMTDRLLDAVIDPLEENAMDLFAEAIRCGRAANSAKTTSTKELEANNSNKVEAIHQMIITSTRDRAVFKVQWSTGRIGMMEYTILRKHNGKLFRQFLRGELAKLRLLGRSKLPSLQIAQSRAKIRMMGIQSVHEKEPTWTPEQCEALKWTLNKRIKEYAAKEEAQQRTNKHQFDVLALDPSTAFIDEFLHSLPNKNALPATNNASTTVPPPPVSVQEENDDDDDDVIEIIEEDSAREEMNKEPEDNYIEINEDSDDDLMNVDC